MDDTAPAPTGEAAPLPLEAAADLTPIIGAALPEAAAVVEPGEVPLMPAPVADVVEGMLAAAEADPAYYLCTRCGWNGSIAVGVQVMCPICPAKFSMLGCVVKAPTP